MKLYQWLTLSITSAGLIFSTVLPAQADIIDGYVGVSLSNEFNDDYSPQVDGELMIPLTTIGEQGGVQVRATTDFNNEVDILPTVSIGLGDVADLYGGVGYSYEDRYGSSLLTRVGLDWNITSSLVGLTYVDYTTADDQVGFTTGLAYRFGGFKTSGPGLEVEGLSPRDRN